MLPPYPVLYNRPIDQWKVTELKQELKRRKLTTKGLKDHLVKRLAEDIRIERENAGASHIERENDENTRDNGIDCVSHPAVLGKVDETVANLAETAKDILDCDIRKNYEADNAAVNVGINDSLVTLGKWEVREGDKSVCTESALVEENVAVHAATMETVVNIPESLASEVAFSGQDLPITETQKENGDSNPDLADEDLKPLPEYEDLKPLPEDEITKPKQEDEGLESKHKIVMPNKSEACPTLGSQVEPDTVSTDSISTNKKIGLKDKIIAENVKIEFNVQPKMVETSSSNVGHVGGESHPMDVEEPHRAHVEAKDDNSADMNRKNNTSDAGYSEKLIVDRSSDDNSMEGYVVETKQIDSRYNSNDVKDRNEKEETPVDVVGDDVEGENCTDVDLQNEENTLVMPAKKRKLDDQAAIGNNEHLKRQRRWNTESVKVSKSQSFNLTHATTPIDSFQSTAFRRSLSISDSRNREDEPKERVIPLSQKPPTNSLRIDRFLRPFTLKAVQDLLGKTGIVSSFWMDQIKTHCYVTYSSIEEAVETRNALYNLQWPPYGGKHLVAEFVDPQDVKTRSDAPDAHAAPTNPAPTVPSAPPVARPQPSPRQPVPRQQPLPPPPPLDPPTVTLDYLFRKTKTSPRIYYLPLSEEQVAAKLGDK